MIINYDKNNNFDELIKDRVLVDFYADWCGPCKMMAPVISKLVSDNNIKVIKVDIDDNEDIAIKYGVMSIPTLIVFDNGREVKRSVGYLSLDKLKEFIK